MSELSPAARAVWEAAMNTPDHMPYEYDIAAALRAAADQVAPEQPHEDTFEYCCDYAQSRVKISIRQQLLAIADELEGQ